MTPELSIIIVTYNSASCIEPCLRSLDAGCSTTTIYGLGWSNTNNAGNSCGVPVPTSQDQVYHFQPGSRTYSIAAPGCISRPSRALRHCRA